jgi:hypothetical protein
MSCCAINFSSSKTNGWATIMIVRIYKPSKTAMQSGQGHSDQWVLEPAAPEPVAIDPLMGWSGSSNTAKQVTLSFASKDEAIAYAEREGLAYTVVEPEPVKRRRRSYADNFKFGRVGSWTH